ncbi:MAG: cytochrome C oxidase subunit II, partial [Alphaproteobacteria bacterium]|nr:cytochrome C oxidase subunit II [Alphaproteobacteria bacterium]
MAIFPPTQRLWWKEPIEKSEILWIGIALTWALIMFIMMPYWHFVGGQNLSNEAYRVVPEHYGKRVEAMAEKFKVREEKGIPVVHPPAGGDAYIIARTLEWWPIIE